MNIVYITLKLNCKRVLEFFLKELLDMQFKTGILVKDMFACTT